MQRLQRAQYWSPTFDFAGAMPSLAPACSHEAAKLSRERGHAVLRESMPPAADERQHAKARHYFVPASFTLAVIL